MDTGAIMMLAHLAGCVSAAATIESSLGFEKTALWRFVFYPISIPGALLLVPYLAWKDWHDRPDLRGRGRSVLTTMSLRLWLAYPAGVAGVIMALRLAR